MDILQLISVITFFIIMTFAAKLMRLTFQLRKKYGTHLSENISKVDKQKQKRTLELFGTSFYLILFVVCLFFLSNVSSGLKDFFAFRLW
jgi:H+/gluconate symporter-like permease